MKRGDTILAYDKIKAEVLKVGKVGFANRMDEKTLKPIGPQFKVRGVYVKYVNPITNKETKGWFDYYKCKII
jgi:hypothetical protein